MKSPRTISRRKHPDVVLAERREEESVDRRSRGQGLISMSRIQLCTVCAQVDGFEEREGERKKSERANAEDRRMILRIEEKDIQANPRANSLRIRSEFCGGENIIARFFRKSSFFIN